MSSKTISPRAAVVAALAAGAALAVPMAASAGTYKLYSCSPPGVNLAAPTSGPWRFTSTNPHSQIRNTCSQQGGWMGFSVNLNRMEMQSETGWELVIPESGAGSNTGIVRVKDWTQTRLGTTNTGLLFGLYLGPAISSAPGGSTLADGHLGPTFTPPGKEHLLGVKCLNAQCATQAGVILEIHGTETDLFEDVQPSGSIDGGSLVGPGPQRGARRLTYSALDTDSGIEKVELLLDDQIMATDDFARNLALPLAEQTGACTYVDLAACPRQQSRDLTVDTTAVPDGEHTVYLRVRDAAGNAKIVDAGRVTVDNVPDPVVAPPPTGADAAKAADAGARLTMLFINGANGTAAARLTAAFASSQRRSLRVRYGRRALITGRLLTPDGRPIRGARIDVQAQPVTAVAAMTAVGQVLTDASGAFRYVAPVGPSRVVRFAYRARASDREFSEVQDVALRVVARVKLSTNRRRLRNGQAVIFRGRVAGVPKGSRKVVEMQVRRGRGWMTFASTRLRGHGTFRHRYRFTRTTGRVTYTFRARVRREAGFPFETGHSPGRRVTVRG